MYEKRSLGPESKNAQRKEDVNTHEEQTAMFRSWGFIVTFL